MRESSKTERIHLPRDAYEEWLKSQVAKPSAVSHRRKTIEDSYEVWLKKRVERRAKEA